jgi:hypothetical protein
MGIIVLGGVAQTVEFQEGVTEHPGNVRKVVSQDGEGHCVIQVNISQGKYVD